MAVSTGTALLGGTVASGLLGALGAGSQSNAAGEAADAQAQAMMHASDIQQQMQNTYLQFLAQQTQNSQEMMQNATQYGMETMPYYANQSIGALQQGADSAAGYMTGGYQDAQGFLSPYTQAGGQSLDMLMGMIEDPSSYEQSPGYEFLRDESLRGIQASAAAGGRLQSGGTLRELTNYASGLAAQDYQNQYNRLYQMANMGQQSAGAQSNLASQYGANMGNLYNNLAGNVSNIYSGLGTNMSNLAMQGAGAQTNLGQNYANQAGGVMQGTANNLANLAVQGGQNAAAGITNQSNAWTGFLNNIGSGINSGINNYMLYNMFQPRAN